MKKVVVAIILALLLGSYTIVLGQQTGAGIKPAMPESAGTEKAVTNSSHKMVCPDTDGLCLGPIVLSERMLWMICIGMVCVLTGWIFTFRKDRHDGHLVSILTIVLIGFAITVLGLLRVLEGNAISALFGAIVGHVLGSMKTTGDKK